MVTTNSVGRTTKYIPTPLRNIQLKDRLSKDEERELGKRIEEGDEKAVEELVLTNMWLVHHIARKFQTFGVPYADLVCEGTVGLTYAAQRYNWKKDARFATYAHWWVKRSIIRSVLAESGAVNLPLAKADDLFAIKRTETQLIIDNKRAASGAEIAEILGVSEKEVDAIRHATDAFTSLDEPLSDDWSATKQDNIADTDPFQAPDRVLLSERLNLLKDAIEELPDREKFIVSRRYGIEGEEPASFIELARHLGISRQRVQQIERKAIERIREQIGAN